MTLFSCPGSEKFKQPKPETIKCPFCAKEVEIWTDEVKTTCSNCKNIVTRQPGQSCLDWCAYAKECIGDANYNKHMQNKTASVKEKLLEELKKYFGCDTKRINHAEKVMNYAEELLREEKGDWHIVIPASILHDIGIKIAEEKYNSSAGRYQEKEGPAIARNILLKTGFKKSDTDEICQIVAHHHTPGKVNSQNFKIVYDADWLINLKDEVNLSDKEKLEKVINKIFLTATGKKIAEKVYLLPK